MTVLLRITPTQTATRHSTSLSVYELVFCGLPMTFSNFARGLSPQRRWVDARSLRELTLKYGPWIITIKTGNTVNHIWLKYGSTLPH